MWCDFCQKEYDSMKDDPGYIEAMRARGEHQGYIESESGYNLRMKIRRLEEKVDHLSDGVKQAISLLRRLL